MPFFGELFSLLTALMWSFTSLAFARATLTVGSTRVNIARLLIALVFLAGSILIFQIPYQLSQKQIHYLIYSGILGLVFGDSFLFKGFQYIGARLSMLLMSLAPAISAVLAFVLLGETLSPMSIIGMIVTIAGIALVVFERGVNAPSVHSMNKWGFLFALFGAIGQGSGLVVAKMAFAHGDIHGFVATFVRLIAALVILIPMALFTGHLRSLVPAFRKEKKAFGLTIIGSFTGPFLGISFSLIAVAHAQVGIAATLMATVPIMMLPLVRVIHQEHLSWKAIMGAVVAVGGVALLFL